MTILRIIAVIHALSLVAGETFRRWGAGRHLAFIVGDYWIAGLLLLGAWAMRSDTLRNRGLFAAGWGVNAGMLYGNFFGKLLEPAGNPGIFSIVLLPVLVGLAFLVPVAGTIAAILLPPKTT